MRFDDRNQVKLWIIENQEGRRNLTDAWKYKLALTSKEILLEMGKAKLSEAGKEGNEKRWNKSPLSTMDKPDKDRPAHNTREIIAKKLGWSSTRVARADVVFKAAEPPSLFNRPHQAPLASRSG